MRELTIEGQRAVLETALALTNEHTDGLSQDDFSAVRPQHPEWAIGPFRRDEALTFRPRGQAPDPVGIGWTSSSVFNPSLIADGDDLVMFYRSSPRKESLSSRIGMARLRGGAADPAGAAGAAADWQDVGTVLWPTLDNELYGCEDPKIYRADGRWYLFYNGIFPAEEEDRARFPSPGYPVLDVGCDINLAVSDDLVHWEKLGPIIDHETSRLWAKGAVIVRDPAGAPVRIGSEYLMYLSEGCGGRTLVGRSADLVDWRWVEQPYLDVAPLGGHLHEVACAVTGHGGSDLIIDFFYSDQDGRFAAAQARYDLARPFEQSALSRGGTLSWGGLLQRDGQWLIAQGWDAPPGQREISLYRAAVRP
jgi:hypothetical protein